MYSLVKVSEKNSATRSEACLRTQKQGLLCCCFVQSKIKKLEETLHLHRFYNSCQEFESWMEDKENILSSFSSTSEDLGVTQAKYEVNKQLVCRTEERKQDLCQSTCICTVLTAPHQARQRNYMVLSWIRANSGNVFECVSVNPIVIKGQV